MSDDRHRLLIILEAHRANLAACKTFEEYQAVHVAYVDCLIDRTKAMIAQDEAEMKFVYRAATSETAQSETEY